MSNSGLDEASVDQRRRGWGHKSEEPPNILNTNICCRFLELVAILLTGRLYFGPLLQGIGTTLQ
jgi:hypothetical protein